MRLIDWILRRHRDDDLQAEIRAHLSMATQDRIEQGEDPSPTSSTARAAIRARRFVRSYPRFRAKRLLRFLFDHFQSDLAFNLLLGTRPMRAAASIVYFHRKGAFDGPLLP